MAKNILQPSNTWRGLVVAGLLLLVLGCASAPPPVVAPPPPTSAAAGATTIVAIAPPPAPATAHPTVGQFLGLPQLAKGIGGVLQRIGSRLLTALDLTGRFPSLQPKPPVVPLTDPANLQPTAPPAVQAAAEIKQEEDAAPQKIMAIRYLATLGCGGCYDKVEDALLQALSDCTEEVRYEAVKALACQPQSPCKFCNTATCCSAKVRKRLEELTNCEKEPSERIRRNARIKLACCSAVPLPFEDIPREGPPGLPVPPLTAVPALATGDQRLGSRMFEGIQLVSFQASVTPPSANDPVLAYVNGEPIFRSQVLPLVDARWQSLGKSAGEQAASAERELWLAAELQRVVDWRLIAQYAQRDADRSSTATATGMSPAEVRAWFEQRLIIEAEVTPQQILAHYEVYRERYRQPVRVRWECSRVWIDRCGGHAQAQATAAYLRDRAIGGQMAPPNGLSREQITAEKYDWHDLHMVEPLLIRTVLASLQNGQVSPILEQQNQLLLLRMLERTPDEYLPLPRVAERIREEILMERGEAAEKTLIAQLRSNSQIATAFDSIAQVPGSAVTLDRGTGPSWQVPAWQVPTRQPEQPAASAVPTTGNPTTELPTSLLPTTQLPTTQLPTTQPLTQFSPAAGIAAGG